MEYPGTASEEKSPSPYLTLSTATNVRPYRLVMKDCGNDTIVYDEVEQVSNLSIACFNRIKEIIPNVVNNPGLYSISVVNRPEVTIPDTTLILKYVIRRTESTYGVNTLTTTHILDVYQVAETPVKEESSGRACLCNIM